MKRSHVHILATGLCVAAGFALTFRGFSVWDDVAVHNHSMWLLMQYGLLPEAPIELSDNGSWTAPLWDLFVGIATGLLQLLHDPIWVRHALTAALFPLTLFWTYALLRAADIQKSTAILGIAFLLGMIRFGGHALVNVRDFPAASGYLLSTLILWVMMTKAAVKKWTTLHLAVLGIVAAVPFLLRSPLLLHVASLAAILTCTAIMSRTMSLRKRVGLVAIPLVSALLFIIALSPRLWSVAPADWLHPVALFTRFPWMGPVRVMGHEYASTMLPWWYPFAWILVGIHPLVLLCGWIGIFVRKKFIGRSVSLRNIGLKRAVPLHHVLFILSIAGFLGMMVLQPTLYDEDRHLLFLYPPLILGCALLWDGARDRTKYLLALLIALSSLLAHLAWWPYAYVYKSPLILDRSAQAFMGDYRGVCINDGIDALPGRVASGATIVVEGPMDAAMTQYRRRREGLLARTNMPEYVLTQKKPARGSYAVLAYNRINALDAIFADVDAGRAVVLWSKTMPPGEPACVVAWYGET